MEIFLPDGLPTFKVVNEVLELTGFNRFELWTAELFNKLPSITLEKTSSSASRFFN